MVTYDAVVTAHNPALQFKPGMTAQVTFVTARHEGVLVVPNVAFRIHLYGAGVVSGQRPGTAGQRALGAQVSGSVIGTGDANRGEAQDTRQSPWILREGHPEQRGVQVGLTDGERTEIVAGLRAGEQVIIGRTAS